MNQNNANKNSPDAKHIAKALLLGLIVNFHYVLFIKLITFKFPVNFFTVALMIICGLGFPLGIISSARGAAWLKSRSWTFAALILLYLFTAIVNQNVTTHFLLGSVYYPYPMPPRAYFFVGCLVASLLLSPALMYLAGALFGETLRSAKNGAVTHGLFALGMSAGAALGYFSVLWAGLYIPIAVCCAISAALLPDRKAAVAAIALCAVMLGLSIKNKNNVFYVWRIDEYKHLSSHWTPYYRIDFISFSNNHCLGGVYNTLMIWYTCDNVDMLPAEMRRILKEVSRGRENILLAGRTDGLYASMITAANPNVKKFLSVAEDPVAARMMTGPYSRYNSSVFKRPEMDVRSGDIRQFLNSEAAGGKKYDLVFLNGIGIALVMLPHGVMKQEDYLTAKENYEVIFNKLLDSDGVFVIDWGSSQYDEFYPMMANIPPGVHARVFHFWLGEFPLSGLPLFYIIASRNEKELDRIAAELLTMPSIMEMKLEPAKIKAAKFSEDRPFHLKRLAPGLMGLMLPAFFLLVIIASHAGFREKYRMPATPFYKVFYAAMCIFAFLAIFSGQVFNSSSIAMRAGRFGALAFGVFSIGFIVIFFAKLAIKYLLRIMKGEGRISTYFLLAGLCFGLVETCLYSRISRLMPGGPGPGAMHIGVVFCIGLALPLLLSGKRSFRGMPSLAASAAIIILLLPWLSSGLHEWKQALALVLLLSAAACVPWAMGLARMRPFERPRAIAVWSFGTLAGLYIFNWLVVTLGYNVAAIISGITFISPIVFARALPPRKV